MESTSDDLITLTHKWHCEMVLKLNILAPKMFKSLQAGEAVTLESIKTIASGLAPPMAGKK